MHLEVVYYPEKFQVAGTVQLTLSDDENNDRASRMKGKMEFEKMWREEKKFIFQARFSVNEIEEKFGLQLDSGELVLGEDDYQAEMVLLTSWFMSQWMDYLRWGERCLNIRVTQGGKN